MKMGPLRVDERSEAWRIPFPVLAAIDSALKEKRKTRQKESF